MINDLVKKIAVRTALLSVVLIGIIFFIYPEPKKYILGYIFGTLISVLTFMLLKNTVVRSVRMEPERATRFAAIQYFIRMIIYLITIMVGAIADYLDLVTVIVGLMSIKITIYLSAIFDEDFK